MMGNKGQIYATDRDVRRLAPIFDRLSRANARNVQVRAPRGEQDVLSDLVGRCDLVFVDAPCTGTGTWRRNPDANGGCGRALSSSAARRRTRCCGRRCATCSPGGRLLYATCSVLREENEDRIDAFLAEHPDLAPVWAPISRSGQGCPSLAERASPFGAGLRLTPRTAGTDGFYIAALSRLG